MEVHHHAHTHTERKKWFHYFWEFLMLFLAVTLGFFVENQREHQVEHQRLIRFAKQLIKGLERDTTQQNGMIAVLNLKETSFDSLRYFLAMPRDDSIKWKGVYRNVWGLENPFRYSYQKPVFDQINYSGSLRLFTNSNIVDSLTGYIYNGTIIEWQTNAEIEYITGIVIPFMNTHFDKNLIEQRFQTYIKKPGWDTSMIGHVLPPHFLDHVAEWKLFFENIVITAREKHELPYLNILEEREKALMLISSLKKEYHLN
jgi:hypothetical protein